MGTESTSTIKLDYDDNGGAGTPAFVFVHGWSCDRTYFAPQYEHFGRDHRAVAVDLRGHGKSPHADDGDYTVPAFARDVAALIEELALAPAVVVGHSMGGVIATELAASRPDLVAAAVMVDPAPMVVTDELRAILQGLFGQLVAVDDAEMRRNFVTGMFAAYDDPERAAHIIDSMCAVPHAVAGPAVAGMLAYDGAAALASVTRPIACINSDGPTNERLALKAANPNILVAQTMCAGHFNQLEVPDQVNAMIEQFLRVTLPAA